MSTKITIMTWLNRTMTYKLQNMKSCRLYQMSTAVNSMKKDDPKQESTFQSKEVKKFSEQMNIWWDLTGLFKVLHSMNAIRVPFIRDGLVYTPDEKRTLTPLKGKKILDVGCGGGILSEALSKIGGDVTGIDPSKELIDVAKEHSELNSKLTNKPNYACSTIEDHLKERKCYYDGVVASEVIEHIENKELFVKSCIETLKPGGRIFFTTPNRTRPSQICGIYIAEYVLNLLPKGTHQYEMFITPNELTFLLERNGCQVEIIYGMLYNVLSQKFQFVNSQVFMYALQAKKLDNPN